MKEGLFLEVTNTEVVAGLALWVVLAVLGSLFGGLRLPASGEIGVANVFCATGAGAALFYLAGAALGLLRFTRFYTTEYLRNHTLRPSPIGILLGALVPFWILLVFGGITASSHILGLEVDTPRS